MENTISILTAIGTTIGAIVAAIGLVLAARSARNAADELRRKNRLTSVTLVADALNVFNADKDMQTMFYKIEYGEFKYHSDFQNSSEERQLDKLLRHLSAIAHARNNGFVQQADMELLQYCVSRILRNKEVQKYFKWLFPWAKEQGLEHPYHALIELSSSA